MRWIPFRAFERDAERGSEVVSTVLVQGLVVVLILLLVQVAFASHVRTMSVSAASEGARRGGLLGGDEEEAVARTSELLDSLVGASRDREIEVEREPDGDTDVLVVTVRTRLPLVGGLGAAMVDCARAQPRGGAVSERGDASVEFVGVLVAVVIPLLYVALALGQVSAGAMAVDAGAREAARILAEDSQRQGDAERAVSLIVEDFGVDATPVVSSSCVACESRRSDCRGCVFRCVFLCRLCLPGLVRWVLRCSRVRARPCGRLLLVSEEGRVGVSNVCGLCVRVFAPVCDGVADSGCDAGSSSGVVCGCVGWCWRGWCVCFVGYRAPGIGY